MMYNMLTHPQTGGHHDVEHVNTSMNNGGYCDVEHVNTSTNNWIFLCHLFNSVLLHDLSPFLIIFLIIYITSMLSDFGSYSLTMAETGRTWSRS